MSNVGKAMDGLLDTLSEVTRERDSFSKLYSDSQNELKHTARRIRDAVGEWEASGDGEKLINEVIDPWLSSILDVEATS